MWRKAGAVPERPLLFRPAAAALHGGGRPSSTRRSSRQLQSPRLCSPGGRLRTERIVPRLCCPPRHARAPGIDCARPGCTRPSRELPGGPSPTGHAGHHRAYRKTSGDDSMRNTRARSAIATAVTRPVTVASSLSIGKRRGRAALNITTVRRPPSAVSAHGRFRAGTRPSAESRKSWITALPNPSGTTNGRRSAAGLLRERTKSITSAPPESTNSARANFRALPESDVPTPSPGS